MTASGHMTDGDAAAGATTTFRARRRERSRVSRMIGSWPPGLRFEDAIVPREGFFRGGTRDVPGIWPESTLGLQVRIVRGR